MIKAGISRLHLSHRLIVCLLVIIMALPAVPASVTTTAYANDSTITLYVSPSGTGQTCAVEDPCSLETSQSVVRSLNSNMAGNIIVNLLGGTYYRSDTWELTSEDSGSNGYDVIYRAAPGQEVVFDGGQVLDQLNWQLYDADKGIYQTIVPANMETRQLYVDGQRAYRASSKTSPAGWGVVDQGYQMSDADMASWNNKEDIEVVILRWWQMHRCPVESINGDRMTIEAACWNPYGHTNEKPTWIENAYELLDESGEWYLDRTGAVDRSGVRKLYYKPNANTNMADSTFVVPKLQTFITGEGTIEDPIQRIRIEGIVFQHSTWLEVNDWGYIERQGGLRYTRDVIYENAWGDTTVKVPSALSFRAAHHIGIERNVFRHFGASALNFEYGSQNNQVIGNVFEDLSAGALFIGSTNDHHPSDAREIVKNNVVSNNLIRNVAVEYFGTTAIWVGYTEKTQLLHNEIDFVPYSGISMGWGWGNTDAGGAAGFADSSVARDNEIAYNQITNVSRVLHDGGAIYTLGAQENSTIHHNVVDGVGNADNPLDNAIYLDEASRYFNVNHNVIRNAYHWLFLWTASIRDNVATNNYTQTERLRNDGTNNTITNTTVVQDGNWPQEAQNIAAAAGIEPAYQSIKQKAVTNRNALVTRDYEKQQDSNGYYTGLESEIRTFTIEGQSCGTRIDPLTKKLFLCMPEGTDVTALVPQLTLKPGYTATPASGSTVDFISPVIYTVTTPNHNEVNWSVQVIVTGGAINGSKVDESFYSISEEIVDSDNWVGGTVEFVGDSMVSKRGFTTYVGKKFGDEILDFEMELPLRDWNGFAIRTANPNQSFERGNSNYLVVVTDQRWELQKWVKGAREMLIGGFQLYTPRWGYLANTQFTSNRKHRIQVGAINVDEGVRLVMYVDGAKIFDVVDTVDPFRDPGYFSIYSANSPITISPVYSPEMTNVALNKNSALMNPTYTSYVFPQNDKEPSKGNDGDLNTATQAVGAWDWSYLVDLGAVYTIDRMAVQFEQDLYASSFEFNWQDDQGVWQTLATLAGEGDKRIVHKLPASIQTRYVGVKALAPNGPGQLGGQMSVKEFEVYGWLPVEDIALDTNELTLDIDDSLSMTATVLPQDSTDKRLAWRSSAPDVVRVDSSGRLKAISAGHATITVTSMDGRVSAEAIVKVRPLENGNVAFQRPAKALHPTTYAELGYHSGREPAKGVDGRLDTIAQATDSYAWIYAVDLGDSYDIRRVEATFGIGYATEYQFVSSLNGSNWTVLDTGTGEANATRSYLLPSSQPMRYVGIRALKPDSPGQAGGQMAIAEFAAYAWNDDNMVFPTGIGFDTGDFTLEVAEKKVIGATIMPENATLKTVNWTSSLPEVASVDANGKVTARSIGSATITAVTEIGEITKSVQVTVIASQSGNLALLRPSYVYDLEWNPASTQPNRPASAGVDGDPDTSVQAEGTYAWQYAVDLGQVRTIGRVAVTFAEGFAAAYQWLGSVDGTHWEVIASRNDGQYWTRIAHTLATSADYRFIAIKAIKPDGPNQIGGQMIISELEVYGAADPGISPTGVEVDRTTAAMIVGERLAIQATVVPEEATNKDLIWSSSNDSIVAVDQAGIIMAKGEGMATVTATTVVGGFTARVSVEVSPSANVALFKNAAAYQNDLTQTLTTHAHAPASAAVDGDPGTFAQASGSYAWSLVVDLGGSYEIKEMAALFGDGFATDYEFVGYVENEGWQTLYTGSNGAKNTRVSHVLETPKVLRYAAIKALKPDGPLQTGGQMFVKEFEVIREMPEVAPASIRLNVNALQLVKNEEISLTAEVLPPQATNKNVIWSTSNPAVAQVDTMGKVTGVGVGTATITATTVSGALTDHLAVTVVKTDLSGNLALFKPAFVYDVPGGTILGTHENRGPGKAVDRLTTTATQADGSYAWTYVVDLEQQVDVGKIIVKFAEGFASEFRILGSVNGVAWETLAQKTASQYGETVIHDPQTAKSLRYVAIQAIKPDGPSQTGGQMILAELEVYAGVRTNNPPATASPATSETPAKSTPPSEHKEEQEQRTEPSLPDASFTDTAGHWASKYIRAAVKRGIGLGYPDGTFRPNERTTRAMVATMLNRLLKLAAKSEWNASDSGKVPDWAKAHMQALWENGIMTGYKDGTLRANEPITRTELIAIIVRALKLKLPDQTTELPFADAMHIPKWAKPYIAAAYDAGLVSGVGGNRFAPNEFATRAEVVKLLYLLDLQQ